MDAFYFWEQVVKAAQLSACRNLSEGEDCNFPELQGEVKFGTAESNWTPLVVLIYFFFFLNDQVLAAWMQFTHL